MASSFWDIILSIACAATDADYQNRIILQDNTLNLPVVARQPHPDPNFVPTRRRAALPPPKEQARHALAVASGAVSSTEPLALSNILRSLFLFLFSFRGLLFSCDRGLNLRTLFLFWHPPPLCVSFWHNSLSLSSLSSLSESWLHR